MQPELPAPVAACFDADAARAAAALARLFANGGVLKDEGEIHAGPEAIRAWRRAAKAKRRHEIGPLSASTQDGRPIVAGRATGDFPGGPATLRFAFELAEVAIDDGTAPTA